MNALSISARPMGAAMQRDWLLSLGLHAALWGGALALSAWLPSGEPPLQRLEVALAWEPAAPPAPAAVAAPTPPPAAPVPVPVLQRREPQTKPAGAHPQPALVSRPPAPEPLAVAPDSRFLTNASEKIAASAHSAGENAHFDANSAGAGQTVAAAQSNVAPPPAGDERTYQQWRALLGQLLEQHKRYPSSARRMGQSGVVVLHLRLDAQGVLLDCDVHQSSGFKALDQAAEQLLRTVVTALRVQVQPGRAADLHVPIVYELKEV